MSGRDPRRTVEPKLGDDGRVVVREWILRSLPRWELVAVATQEVAKPASQAGMGRSTEELSSALLGDSLRAEFVAVVATGFAVLVVLGGGKARVMVARGAMMLAATWRTSITYF